MLPRNCSSLRPLIACLFFLAVAGGCRKEAPHGSLVEGEVALTFDDASVENWRHYLPLLDSLDIKATFYVSHYHTFNQARKAALKEIEKHGHEIAFHTANHLDMAKEAAKSGVASLEAAEIRGDLKLMLADGYAVRNFAYPFGSHTTQLNTCLLRTFGSVRALSNQQNYKKSLVAQSGDHKVLYGANVDNNSRLKEDGIATLMDDARDHHDCLVLVAHQINKPELKLQISRERLIFLSQQAALRGLRFVTVNEITR